MSEHLAIGAEESRENIDSKNQWDSLVEYASSFFGESKRAVLNNVDEILNCDQNDSFKSNEALLELIDATFPSKFGNRVPEKDSHSLEEEYISATLRQDNNLCGCLDKISHV